MSRDDGAFRFGALAITARTLVIAYCDSFNSLALGAQAAFLHLATVLHFLSKKLKAAENGTLPRQF